jgi:hypothetical protein
MDSLLVSAYPSLATVHSDDLSTIIYIPAVPSFYAAMSPVPYAGVTYICIQMKTSKVSFRKP